MAQAVRLSSSEAKELSGQLVQLVQLSRTDVSAFCACVMRDEHTGLPFEQAPMHQAWHELAAHNPRLLLWSAVEFGKTSQLSIARTLWELGKDPTLRVVIVSNTHRQAAKLSTLLARYIESSADLHQVFPKLRPYSPWNVSQLTIHRPYLSKDPSVQITGVHGNVLGSRIDRLILDDVLDYENCRTPELREDLWNWTQATLMGRLTARARVLVTGTAFHPDDLMHRFAKQPGWKAVRYPVVDEMGNPRWPQAWPLSRIAERRAEMSPAEFARQMLCVARDDLESRFRWEWIQSCIKAGEGVPEKWRNIGNWNGACCTGLKVLPPGCKTYTGVDLAVQKKDSAGLTVLFNLIRIPDETRMLLDINSGRWTGPEIVDRIVDAHRRYYSLCIVENNAAQDYILQFTRATTAVPLRAFTTGRNKAHPEFGVESLATEMSNGKWIIPSIGGVVSPEANAWIQEMLYYDPKGHTGDRLMGSYFAREGIRLGELKAESGYLDLASR